jgi:type I site-specific restriction endonuclease
MMELNLPSYTFRVREQGQNKEIFDSVRRKFVTLTPEEWVRQHLIQFMVQDLKYPGGRMAVEKGFELFGKSYRADIVVHDAQGRPWMIVECKSPEIDLNEQVFYQAATYHLKLNVRYLVISNGIQHYCCKFADGSFRFHHEFPSYAG